MNLTVDNVISVITDCLFGDRELVNGKPPVEDMILVNGIMRGFGLHKHRLEEQRENIKSMLEQLPEKLKEGCSFVELCVTKDGHQWGEHVNMEELMVLGMAVDLIHCCAPEAMWNRLPGGMPYYQYFPNGVPEESKKATEVLAGAFGEEESRDHG